MIGAIKGYLWDLYVRGFSEFLHRSGNHSPDKKPIRRILIYHRLDKDSVKDFKRQISYFTDNYKVLSLSNFIKVIVEGNTAREDILCFTIDDAYKSIYQYAVPILDKYSIKPCIFVPVDFINTPDKKRYIRDNLAINVKDDAMTWDQLKVLVKKGYEIGSHSFSHADFGDEKMNIDFRFELGDSKARLEEILNTEVKYFAFPFGYERNIPAAALEKTKEYGYDRAFSGIRRAAEGNGFLLSRTYINLRWNENVLRCVLSGCFDKSASFSLKKGR